MCSKKILVIDDEQDVLVYLKSIYEDAGYKVISGSNGVEALDLAKSEKPDLITLDITMPEESGVKAYKNLRSSEVAKDIPVIIITGYEDPKFEKFISTRKTAPPPDGFFDKPINRDELLKKTKEILK
jgi:CheY-like chemotaxis protein